MGAIIDGFVIACVSFLTFFGYAAGGIFPGDAGDLVVASVTAGVPHPPGYPLYTMFGWLVTRLPFHTPAWRMAVLSGGIHAATLVLAYLVARRLSGRRAVGIFAAAVLFGNYIFFLYSVTPEVFALLDFFVVWLLYIGLRLSRRFTERLFLVLVFSAGLAATHHPLIVLLFPSLVLLLRAHRRHIWSVRVAGAGLAALAAGALPYLYVAGAARGLSMINWDRATNISRLIRLISRADYGTFMSGSTVGHSLIERLLNVKVFFGFLIFDVTWVGIVLALIGLVWLWKRQRMVAAAFGLGYLLIGPAFSFYSSFPIVNRFVLGTVERFSLPSYVLLAPLIAVGAWTLSRVLASWVRLQAPIGRKRSILEYLILGILFLYPLTTAGMTLWRFGGISSDRTTDQFAQDLLDSAPAHAIVFLTRDTPLFGVQYMRYALGYRSDTVVLHTARMPFADYHEVIHGAFPSLVLPVSAGDQSYVSAFVLANSPDRPIMTNSVFPVAEGWAWVPHGLLYMLTPPSHDPVLSDIESQNTSLWASFHDPKRGALSRYRHLFLTNVLDEYAILSNEYGTYLLRRGEIQEAKKQFERAVSYGSDTQSSTAWMYTGLSQSLLGDCDAAFQAYDKARQPQIASSAALLYYEAVTWRDCAGNPQRADALFFQYRQFEKQGDIPLGHPQQ